MAFYFAKFRSAIQRDATLWILMLFFRKQLEKTMNSGKMLGKLLASHRGNSTPSTFPCEEFLILERA
jgi:hypothetical protein